MKRLMPSVSGTGGLRFFLGEEGGLDPSCDVALDLPTSLSVSIGEEVAPIPDVGGKAVAVLDPVPCVIVLDPVPGVEVLVVEGTVVVVLEPGPGVVDLDPVPGIVVKVPNFGDSQLVQEPLIVAGSMEAFNVLVVLPGGGGHTEEPVDPPY